MENKINILENALEQMISDAEENGRDSSQLELTTDDVALIIEAMEGYKNYRTTCVGVADQTCGETIDIYQTDCKDCVHAPICEYCANNLKNFTLQHTAGDCAMYDPECDVGKIASPFVDTIEGMISPDYKERFKAEYDQTKIRYERIKAFNNKIEAANLTNDWHSRYEMKKVEMPKHDCPDDILKQQQRIMGEYLHILEVRAVIEGVDLS